MGIIREKNVYGIQPFKDGVELISKNGVLQKFLENPTQEFEKLRAKLSLADYFICSKFIARRELVDHILFDWQRMVIRVSYEAGDIKVYYAQAGEMGEIVADITRDSGALFEI